MSRRFVAPVLVAVIATLLVSAAPSFAASDDCGVVNHHVCLVNADFDPVAPGGFGQQTLTLTNTGGNTVNNLVVTLSPPKNATVFGLFGTPSASRGTTTVSSDQKTVTWNIGQLKSSPAELTLEVPVKAPSSGPISICANAAWNELTRNRGRQDGIFDLCESTDVGPTSDGTFQSVLPDKNQVAASNVRLQHPSRSQTGTATFPLEKGFTGAASIGDGGFTNPPCNNDRLTFAGLQWACRAGDYYKVNVQSLAGSGDYNPTAPIIIDLLETSGRFDDPLLPNSLPLGVFVATDTGDIFKVISRDCTSATPLDCLSTKTVGGGFTHLVAQVDHLTRYR